MTKTRTTTRFPNAHNVYLWLIGALLSVGQAGPLLAEQPAAYDRVIMLCLDGVSSSGLLAAQTPHLDQLRTNGASTLETRAVMPTSSLPNWGAFLYGADTEQTGITSNR